MDNLMGDGLNNFFSRRDLGGVDPEFLECELKLYNVKEQYNQLQAKVLMFYNILKDASEFENNAGEEAEFWREIYKNHFDIQISRNGTTEG